jgi:hypothetical protein
VVPNFSHRSWGSTHRSHGFPHISRDFAHPNSDNPLNSNKKFDLKVLKLLKDIKKRKREAVNNSEN